jgi:hypothetical protein
VTRVIKSQPLYMKKNHEVQSLENETLKDEIEKQLHKKSKITINK